MVAPATTHASCRNSTEGLRLLTNIIQSNPTDKYGSNFYESTHRR